MSCSLLLVIIVLCELIQTILMLVDQRPYPKEIVREIKDGACVFDQPRGSGRRPKTPINNAKQWLDGRRGVKR